jgi:hypothetical protein
MVALPEVLTQVSVALPGGGFAVLYAWPCQFTIVFLPASAQPCSTRPLRAIAAGTVNRASAV